MEWITAAVDVLLHLDSHLEALIAAYGPWVYAILFLIVFNIFPLLYSLGYSFTQFRASTNTAPVFVGLKNYQHMINDKLFWTSLVNTLIYTVMSVTIFMVFALGGKSCAIVKSTRGRPGRVATPLYRRQFGCLSCGPAHPIATGDRPRAATNRAGAGRR